MRLKTVLLTLLISISCINNAIAGTSMYIPTYEDTFGSHCEKPQGVGRLTFSDNDWDSTSSSLFGVLASKFFSDEKQKEWFVQRIIADYGYKQLQDKIACYQRVADSRGLNKKEYDDAKKAIIKRDTIIRDLNFVYKYLDGDLDAPMDKADKSFRDRWASDLITKSLPFSLD